MKDSIINFLSGFGKENIGKSFPLPYCLPVYHCVSDENLPHIRNVIQYKNVRQFENDLDEFSKYFQFITWDEFKQFIRGNFRSEKTVALLTFDDGFREFYDVVAPILERKGIYAINFINPAFIDNRDLMFRCKASLIVDRLEKMPALNPEIQRIFHSQEDLKTQLLKIRYAEREKLDRAADILDINFNAFLNGQKPYLSFDQLNTLTEKGFGISSHSWDHPRYHELSLQQQLDTTFRTSEYLKEHHFLYESFAFPFTDFGVSEAFFNEVFKNNEIFCTFGSAGLKLDSVEKNFQRIPMETGESAAAIINKEIAYFKVKKFLNKNKIIRR
ncbi:polysaccharide deacetylase family protein [Chryseobacterium fluminis]|uniref:polysaccharide deacetylase family protein n=1 Tax=Chryseobacterium fluminis TaxID=2983606 RepID=UPI002254E320|nr:polysaccharide deacetylase family protein [Chryseobacterium sp. MMS21-Ot14]UZT97401.1 polysaccharide deacetylase family protein [Chryseobacterium sp. MMS21-Ot14]